MSDPEYLSSDDFGGLIRVMHAKAAGEQHYAYFIQRLWAKLGLASADEIDETTGLIRRAPAE